MHVRSLFLLIVGSFLWGCGSESSDGGPVCEGLLVDLGSSPIDGAQGIATDAHPSVIQGNNTTCPLPPRNVTAGPITVVVFATGTEVDGVVVKNVEGTSAITTFLPATPLLPNTKYKIDAGTFHTTFSTGTATESPPPPAVTVSKLVAYYFGQPDQTLHVEAPLGTGAAIVHFVPSDADGKPITDQLHQGWAFVTPGALPIGDASGDVGVDEVGEVCFFAQSENEAGVLSKPSKPRCVSPESR